MSVAVIVELPRGLCQLSGASNQIRIEAEEPLTQRTILDSVERIYPMLEGTIRDHTTRMRRPFIRFFVDGQDLSHLAPDDPLPCEQALVNGREPFLIIGAIAGGTE